MPDSVRPNRRQPTRLHHPWDSPGKNTGVGCHLLLQCMKAKNKSEVAQSCLEKVKTTHSGKSSWDTLGPQGTASLHKGSSPFFETTATLNILWCGCHQNIHLLNYFKSKVSAYRNYSDVYWIHNDNLISIFHSPLISHEVK